jgi:hypothetical protein
MKGVSTAFSIVIDDEVGPLVRVRVSVRPRGGSNRALMDEAAEYFRASVLAPHLERVEVSSSALDLFLRPSPACMQALIAFRRGEAEADSRQMRLHFGG